MPALPEPCRRGRRRAPAGFDQYIEGEAAKAAANARKEAGAAFKTIVDAALELNFDETLAHDLEVVPELAIRCTELQKALKERRDAVRAAVNVESGVTWDQVPTLSEDPCDTLNVTVAAWREAAAKLEQSQDAAARAKMEKEPGGASSASPTG